MSNSALLSKREENRLARRAAIVAMARDTFLSEGYAATSMSTIASRLGGSKGTLWSYFRSKEELFAAVISDITAVFMNEVKDALRPGATPQSTLRGFGERFLAKLLDPVAISLLRLIIAEAERFPEIGRTFYENAPRQVMVSLTEYLSGEMAAGRLRTADPALAARQMIDLLLSPHRQILWGVASSLGPHECRVHSEVTVDFFLRGYGVAPQD